MPLCYCQFGRGKYKYGMHFETYQELNCVINAKWIVGSVVQIFYMIGYMQRQIVVNIWLERIGNILQTMTPQKITLYLLTICVFILSTKCAVLSQFLSLS